MSNNNKNVSKKPEMMRVNIKLPNDIVDYYKSKSADLGIAYSNLISLDIITAHQEREKVEKAMKNMQYPNNKRK